MKKIWIIAFNTFREIIRDRILYGLVIFAVLLMGLSLALGELSFSEQARISADFGLAAIHLCAMILSVFVGSTLVAREIDKKTIMTLLARPVSRLQFILGKCLGLTMVTTISILGLALVLASIFYGISMQINSLFLIALFGILLESVLLLAFTVFFSSFASSFMVVAFSIAVFLIGHWIHSLTFFAKRSESEAFILISNLLTSVLPDLEKFQWRSHFIYGDAVSGRELLLATGYSLSWFVFLITATVLVFRRRDFG